MSLEIIIILIIVLINIVLGLFVFINNSKSQVNSIFFFMTIFVSVWILSNFFENEPLSLYWATMALRIDFSFAAAVAYFFLIFCLSFPNEREVSSLKKIILFLPAMFFMILPLFNLVIVDPKQSSAGITYNPDIFFIPYAIFIIVYAFWGFLDLLRKYKSSTGRIKSQILYILFGFFISMFISIIMNIFLQPLGASREVLRLGIYGIIFFILFTAYAIGKHRLLDIRFLVVRSLTYFFLLAIFGIMYMLSIFVFGGLIFGQFTGREAYWASMIVALLVGFTFYPLKRSFTKWTDKVFFKDRYDFEELTSQLNETATSTIILPELLFKFLNLLVDEMRVTRGAFVLLEKDKIYESQTLGYKQVLNLEKSDIDHLSKERKIEVFDEAEEGSVCKDIMRRHDAVIILPLIAENDLIGLLFLGEKKSGDAYSQKDIDVLKIVSNQLALGVQNAKAYEQVQKFNFTLRAEINRATKEVKDANTKLVDLDKSKDEFISLASHEIRTPIATLEGYLSILVNQKLKPKDHKDILDRAYDSINRLAVLAKDLLDTSRIDQERLVINREPTRVEVLIERIVEGFEFRAKEKGIFVKYKKADRLLPEANIDPERISEVFNNIIGNAIKFTHKGGITVSAGLKDKDNILVSISDTGEGIPKDDIPNLFKKFYQAQTASSILSKDKGGTGLGLYITKNIIDIHGGKIWIESRLRRGTTFFFTLPIK